jgi:dihydrofolate reductase (trimethoprim resistance protein)
MAENEYEAAALIGAVRKEYPNAAEYHIYSIALSRKLDEIKRLRQKPWCHTCGTTVDEVLCPKCTKWWNDNTPPAQDTALKWQMGDTVAKKRGSSWRGKIVGFYSTEFTRIGYAVESYFEPGSVQVWPEVALEDWKP